MEGPAAKRAFTRHAGRDFPDALPALPAFALVALLARLRAVPPGPLLLHDLLGPGDGEGVGRDVLGDRRPGADESAAADAHRGDELGVAPDEHVVLDDGAQLRHSVEVAGDRAGADVRTAPDLRIPEIGEVVRLAPLGHAGLLRLHEVADADLLFEVGVGAQVSERPDAAAAPDAGL